MASKNGDFPWLCTRFPAGTSTFVSVPKETAQLHADQEDQTSFGQRSAVWRYPLPVFLRKTAEGTVEGAPGVRGMGQPVGRWGRRKAWENQRQVVISPELETF